MPTPPATDGASGKRVLREVGETMLMIEAAITRAQRAMEAVRRKLHQAVYLYVDVQHSDSYDHPDLPPRRSAYARSLYL